MLQNGNFCGTLKDGKARLIVNTWIRQYCPVICDCLHTHIYTIFHDTLINTTLNIF